MLSFIAALYNEKDELPDLISHVTPYVDGLYFADDGSKDGTIDILMDQFMNWQSPKKFHFVPIIHTGLPETVKDAALHMVPHESWVLMLDADERFAPGVLDQIQEWLTYSYADDFTHVYFTQVEIIDGIPVRQFQKSKLFKKEAITFSTGIHEDDQFTGEGIYKADWVVLHRKTSEKQKLREAEYLQTYKRLLEEGKIDSGRYEWLRGLHHFIT